MKGCSGPLPVAAAGRRKWVGVRGGDMDHPPHRRTDPPCMFRKEKTRQPSSSHVATAVATSKKNVQVENRGAPRGALTDRLQHVARVRALSRGRSD